MRAPVVSATFHPSDQADWLYTRAGKRSMRGRHACRQLDGQSESWQRSDYTLWEWELGARVRCKSETVASSRSALPELGVKDVGRTPGGCSLSAKAETTAWITM